MQQQLDLICQKNRKSQIHLQRKTISPSIWGSLRGSLAVSGDADGSQHDQPPAACSYQQEDSSQTCSDLASAWCFELPKAR